MTRTSHIATQHRRAVLRAACNLPVLALLGAGAGAPSHAAAAAEEPAFDAKPWPAAQPTPDIALQDSQGRAWSLAAARGKVVIVNFWATWCEPCRAEMPSLQSLADLYGSELVVLAVNFKERDAKVSQFAKNAGLSLPMPMDRDGAAAGRFGVKVFPSSIVVARDGRARMRVTGEVDWTGRDAARWIEPLLK